MNCENCKQYDCPNPVSVARFEPCGNGYRVTTTAHPIDWQTRAEEAERLVREQHMALAHEAAANGALQGQVAVMDAERVAAAKAKAHADEVRKSLQAGKATAESRALRAEAALAEQTSLDATELDTLRRRLAVAESKIADQAEQIRWLTPTRRQQPRGAVCEVDGCTGEHYARGLCIKHYQRDKRKLAAGICLSCKTNRVVGRSGRCLACYQAIVTTRGREAARCSHV